MGRGKVATTVGFSIEKDADIVPWAQRSTASREFSKYLVLICEFSKGKVRASGRDDASAELNRERGLRKSRYLSITSSTLRIARVLRCAIDGLTVRSHKKPLHRVLAQRRTSTVHETRYSWDDGLFYTL